MNDMRIYICICLLLFVGCQNKANETPIKNNIVAVLELSDLSKFQTKSGFGLSEISSNIDVVPLETKDESLISSIADMIITNTDILIEDVRNGVLRFSRNGDFINKIGKKGNGPDEYIMLEQIEYDEINREVYFFTGRGIKVYSLEGHYKRIISDKSVSEFYDNRQGRCFLFDKYFWLNGKLPLRQGTDALWTFAVYDKNMNYIDEFYNNNILENVEYVKNNRSPLKGWVNYCTESFANVDFYNNEMKILYYGNDTIFKIDREGLNLKPVCFLSVGKKPDFQISHEWIKSESFFKYLLVNDFFESDKYFYFLLGKSNLSYTVRYEKKSGNIVFVESKSNIKETKMLGSPGWIYKRREDSFTFVDDIIGGSKFVIKFRSKGKYLVDLITPSNVGDEKRISNLKNALVKKEKYKNILGVLNDVKEDDNPILLIATLK